MLGHFWQNLYTRIWMKNQLNEKTPPFENGDAQIFRILLD